MHASRDDDKYFFDVMWDVGVERKWRVFVLLCQGMDEK